MCDQLEIYKDCISQQLEEIDMLSSIYCTGEMHVYDPGVISDFNEFIQNPSDANVLVYLKAHLDFSITLECYTKNKLEVRIELPHLYPTLENAIVIVHTPLLSKNKEIYLKKELETFIDKMDKSEAYIFQVISWIQDNIDDLIKRNCSDFETTTLLMNSDSNEIRDFERLWIYSHHIKSKTKRQQIVKQARSLDLSGFSRPGKPGIICVEGLKEHTQEFWQIIRGMRWQKISICKVESARKSKEILNNLRRFEGFKELLFCEDVENEESVMDMGLFLKYLEAHNSIYMKKEFFGLE